MQAEVIQFDPSRRRRAAARPRLRTVDQAAPAPSRPQTAPGLPLTAAWESWRLSMKARSLSPETIELYEHVVRSFGAWLLTADACHCVDDDQGAEADRPCPAGADLATLAEAPGVEHIAATHVRAYLVHRRRVNSAGDAHKHFRSLRTMFGWLIKEGERSAPSPVSGDDEPKVPKKVFPPLGDDELRALLRVCKGDSFEDRRDTAIIRVLMDNGMRVSGLAGIRYTPDDEDTHDVFLSRYVLRIVLKGGDEHWAPLGRKGAAALDRYIRARARRRDATTEPWLWLGKKGRLGKTGIQQMLDRRGAEAGIAGRLGPHRFRRTMADGFLDAGGDPLDLMRVGGWKSLAMVQHYTEARADARALQAHKRIAPGDRI